MQYVKCEWVFVTIFYNFADFERLCGWDLALKNRCSQGSGFGLFFFEIALKIPAEILR